MTLGTLLARAALRRPDAEAVVDGRQRLRYSELDALGGIAVPVNFRLAANELRYVLADSGVTLALCEESTAEATHEAARGTPTTLVFVGDRAPSGSMPGMVRTPTLGRCARAGTSRATWAGSTPRATSGLPGASTT